MNFKNKYLKYKLKYLKLKKEKIGGGGFLTKFFFDNEEIITRKPLTEPLLNFSINEANIKDSKDFSDEQHNFYLLLMKINNWVDDDTNTKIILEKAKNLNIEFKFYKDEKETRKLIKDFSKKVNNQNAQWRDSIYIHGFMLEKLNKIFNSELDKIKFYLVKANDENNENVMRVFIIHNIDLNISVHLGISRSIKHKLKTILRIANNFPNISMKLHKFAIKEIKPKRVYVVPQKKMGEILKENDFKEVNEWPEKHEEFVKKIVLTNDNYKAIYKDFDN
tara:strand:- start:1599 stop:2429 length:831 start_codon:yes stop_codon:yes gene_type:complete